MEANKQLTDSEKLDVINKKLNHIQTMELIKLAVVILGALGAMAIITEKLKHVVKK